MALTKVSGHVVDQPFDVGIITATNQYVSGIGTFANLRVLGDLQVDGTTTTLDTVVTSVDRLEVGANNNTVGVAITQSGTGDIFNLYDGSSEVFSVADGGTVTVTGNIVGVTSAYATKFYGDGSNLTNLAVDATKIETGNTKVETIDTGSDGHVKVTTEGTERLRVQKGGNLVLGTTVEDTGAFRTFHIHGDYTRIKLTDQFSGTGNTDGLDIQCSGGSVYHKFYENGSVYFSTNNTNRFQLTHDGNVKILTSGGMLDGNGSLIMSVSGTERVRIGSAGQIGIGGTNYGTSGQVLTSGGVGSAPSWTTLSTGSTKIEDGNNKVEAIGIGTGGEVKVTTGGTERVIINGDGSNSVKVGTAATFTGAFTNLQLHNAGGSSRIVLTDQFTGNTASDGFHIQCSGGGATLNLKENSHLYFRTNGLLRASVKNSGEFKMHGSNPAVFGDNEYFKIYYDGSCNIENTHSTSNFFIASAFGMQLRVNTSEPAFTAVANGKVTLFYDGGERLETSSTGVKAVGTLDLGNYANSGWPYAPIYDNAVDVFVYDTRKDSDGGAWRKRTQHTSWYNETLNTSHRGATREFPAVAVIVAEATEVTIYDGDDPAMPMWMKFDVANDKWLKLYSSASQCSCISALNGTLCAGGNGNGIRLAIINFISDSEYLTEAGYTYYVKHISKRNSATTFTSDGGSKSLTNNNINDIAMSVRPNAPIDDATGLPIPSIAVATDVGINIIRDDGTVRVVSDNLGTSRKFERVAIVGTDVIGYNNPNGTIQRFFNGLGLSSNSDNDMKYNYTYDGGGGSTENISAVLRDTISVPIGLLKTEKNRLTAFNDDGISKFIDGIDRSFIANSFSIYDSAVAYITSDYNTGYMHGDIQGAYLSDTDTTNVTGSNLIINGTFDSDTSNWTAANGATITQQNNGAPGGNINIASGSSSNGYAYQTVTTVVGKTYVLHVEKYHVDGSAGYVNIGTSVGGSQYVYQTLPTTSSWTHHEFTFKATTTTTTIGIYSRPGGNVRYDNIFLRIAEPSRSVVKKGQAIHGTITKSAVATGAELVAYSGWSASNYMRSRDSYNFGSASTVKMCIMGWFKTSSISGYAYIGSVYNTTAAAVAGIAINAQSDSDPGRLYIYDNITGQSSGTTLVNDGEWHCAVAVFDGPTRVIYLDGRLEKSFNYTSFGLDISAVDNVAVGHYANGNNVTYENLGSLSLVRFSKSLPSAERVKQMYEEEKQLFIDNADATLYGSSDTITAAAFDDTTNILYAGTSAGRSDFDGLRRINNTTTAVTTAISASNELVAEQ